MTFSFDATNKEVAAISTATEAMHWYVEQLQKQYRNRPKHPHGTQDSNSNRY